MALVVKNPPANAGEIRVPTLGGEDILEEKWQPPPQYSCPEDPMDRGAWRATVHRVTKGWT